MRVKKLPPKQEAIRAKCFHPLATFVEFPTEDVETSIPARFEKIVRMYPGRLAVKTSDEAVTYEQLNRAANRVSWAILERLGDGNKPIAILVEHDVAAITLILGVLKAGKIYVPLDLSFPAASIESVLSDSQANLLIANHRSLGVAKSLTKNGINLLGIDASEQASSDANPRPPMGPDNLATILYTSGSTGKPKGVLKNHRGILYNIMTYTNDVHISIDDRLTLLHSCATAASVRNLLGALLNGATVYLFDAQGASLAALADWLIHERITIFHSSASLFRALTDVLTDKNRFDELRLIQLSNESVLPGDVRKFNKFFATTAIFANRLGTTETDTFSRYFIANDTCYQDDVSVPAGFPFAGTEILLLDEHRNDVGFDSVGEIVVKSRHLALGYWQQPDLTRAKFIADPNGGDERWYFTGDLGRITSDGCLYHLGRKDFAVKLRGRRVILTEIETALRENPAIKQVAAVAIATPTGEERRLAAYIVASRRPPPTITELRNYLKQKLPEYMIPSVFVTLDSLPLTPNGKVDRSALPEPDKTRPNLEVPFVAPCTPVEKILVSIWAEVIGLDEVGIYDNFFELGGDSLSATRVVSRVLKHFELKIPLQFLFQAPTIAAMGAFITMHQENGLDENELGKLLNELESLSDEEVQRLVSEGRRRDS